MRAPGTILLCVALAGCSVTPTLREPVPPRVVTAPADNPPLPFPIVPMPRAALLPLEQHSENSFRAAVVMPAPKTLTISWTFPSNRVTPDLVFKLYHSTNLFLPLKQWPVLTSIPGTNRSFVVQPIYSQDFFTLTASNYLGESGYATK